MSLATFGRELLAEVRRIAEQIVRRDGTKLRWATITDTDPLRIRYDGETSESIVPPQNLAAGLNIGDRVRVGKQDGQATIIGPHGGHRAIARDGHYLRIGDDGAPRLWADPELVHGREYTNAGPGADRNRVMVVTQFGTLGTLAGALDRDYLPYRIASGRVDIVVPSGQTEASTTVTFPAGRFTAAPNVALGTRSTASTLINYGFSGVSATSMTITVHRTSTAVTIVEWVATQE